MASLIENLITTLEEESSLYAELTKESMAKTPVIVANDLVRLQEANTKEQEIVDRITGVSHRRDQVLSEIATVLGKDAKTITVSEVIKLMEKQPDYIKQLEALPPKLREAWLYGRWDIFEGQFFEELRTQPDGESCRLAGITPEERKVVAPALQKAEETGDAAAAMELPDGTIVTGKTSDLLGSSAAVLMNALKALARIRDKLHIIAPAAIAPIQHLKVDHLGNRNPRLHTDETLIALSISAATNPMAERAMEQLDKLRGCEVHSSVILSPVDERTFRRLGINLTCEPRYMG